MSLREGQYQIGDLVFGKGTKIAVASFDQTGYSVSAGDTPLPQSDEMRFRKDFLQPGQIQMQLAIMDNFILESVYQGEFIPPGTIVGADELLEDLLYEWRGEDTRMNWGTTKPLTYRQLGQTRVVYGRPRDLTADRRIDRPGWYMCTLAYQRADTYVYSDDVFFAYTGPNQDSNIDRFSKDGQAPTWPSINVHGPIGANAKITIGNKVITLQQGLTADQSLVIECAPWARRAVRSDGVNIRTQLINGSPYLDQIRIAPKAYTPCRLDATGTGANTYLFITWREAYHAL